MKRIAGLCLCIAIGLTVLNRSAAAQGVRLGAEVGIGTDNDNVDDGIALQGYMDVDASPSLILRGSLVYFEGDTEVDILSQGLYSMFGIEGSALYKIPAQNIYPYIGAGLGYYVPDNDLDRDTEFFLRDVLGVVGEDDLESGVGYHVLAGFSFPIAQGLAFGVNVKYLFLEVDNDARVRDLRTGETAVLTEEVNLDTLFVSGGFLLFF